MEPALCLTQRRLYSGDAMTSRKLLAIFTSGCLIVGCGSHLLSQGLPPAPPMLPATPTENVVYTSTRMVNSLDVASDGVLWAATNGGVLMCSSEGQWRKWTRHDGLPSNEVQGVRCTDRFITVSTPLGQAMLNKSELHNAKWRKADKATVTTNPVQWRGESVSATVEGIRVARGSKRRHIALPVSGGTHATALLPRGKHLWVALFGDGLWQYDGKDLATTRHRPACCSARDHNDERGCDSERAMAGHSQRWHLALRSAVSPVDATPANGRTSWPQRAGLNRFSRQPVREYSGRRFNYAQCFELEALYSTTNFIAGPTPDDAVSRNTLRAPRQRAGG
jgi:hypothetical protein